MQFIAVLIAVAGLLSARPAGAHAGKKHGSETSVQESAPEAAAASEPALAEIAERYRLTVQPIFERACFDCHSGRTKFPWYYSIPGVRGLIDADIKEARVHLDLEAGFPFEGHGSPSEDLDAIAAAIEDGTMPPLRYKLLHPEARLSDAEREAVLKWAQEGRKRLLP
ncbi:MAG TPA: heme-binding domain-containing protein [Bdellovibrionales bacterium]|nr:heme-binding domain-containing protein [Bdellovibrionales bacterium]